MSWSRRPVLLLAMPFLALAAIGCQSAVIERKSFACEIDEECIAGFFCARVSNAEGICVEGERVIEPDAALEPVIIKFTTGAISPSAERNARMRCISTQ